jgi:hypothetical protein
MTWAADAAGHPSPQALKDSDCLFVGQYVGTQYQHYGVSRGYIDQCLNIGLGVMLIFEEWSSQFLGGYDTAIQMMNRMHAGWDALGVPNDGSVCPAVALVDPNPGAVPGNEDALRAFARGVNDACWLPWFTGYGSRYGLDIAQPDAPKMQRRWGVGTWGFGERGDGSLPPDVPADMIQHGNRAAPVGGTDYNTLFRLDMGQWGGPATGEDDELNDLERGMLKDVWERTKNMWDGVPGYGVEAWPTVTEEIEQTLAKVNTLSTGDGGGGGAPDITQVPDAELVAETNRRIAAGTIAPTDVVIVDV